jgi:hypothetical protein
MSNAAPARLSWLVSLFALGLMSGCIVHEYDGDHGDWCEDEYHFCEDSSDCHSNQYCRSSTCQDIPADAKRCTSSSQCGWQESCVDGVCCKSCSGDSDCTNGTCGSDNYCSPQPQPKPDGGTTWPKPDAGTPPPPPPPDGGTCPNPPPPPPPPPDAGTGCRYNADCGYGNYCINAVCYRGCTSSTQCGATETCQSGLCKPAPNQCTNSSQCSTGNDCVDGQCRAQCTSSTQCASGYVCRVGYCLPGTGSGKACTVNCDCLAGERCLNGYCAL